MSSAGIVKPIIILGAARSGTHLLSQAFEHHSDVAYISEPSLIWKAYNADLRHDMLPVSRATPRVKSYIQQRFNQMRVDASKIRICDKTPSNCLRLPFVLEVFPDAKIVHIIRDGRHVVASARHKFLGNVQKITNRNNENNKASSYGKISNVGLLVGRAKHRLGQGVRLPDLPYLLPRFVETTAGTMGMKRMFAWGPVFPGMRSMLKTHSLVEVCALQWKYSVESVLSVRSSRPTLDYFELKFEDLIENYESVSRQLFEFAELEQPKKVYEIAPQGFDATKNLYDSELTSKEREIVMDSISSTLRQLGYN